MRLFVGLPLPENVRFTLSLLGGGVRGARWEDVDNMHLTLRFIGDIPGGTREIEAALDAVEAAPVPLMIRGVGHFPPRGTPRSIWAGLSDETAVRALHARVDGALRRAGVPADPRNFAPHITLARLRNPTAREVADFLGRHGLLESPEFTVDTFALYSSIRTPRGAKYTPYRTYRLSGEARQRLT